MTSRRTTPYLRFSILWITTLLISTLANQPRTTQAASFDTIADRVLGQSSFTTNTPNAGATGLRSPWGIAIDQNSGRIYVADSDNNRVLSWPSAATFTNGQAADIVIGQADFESNKANRYGGVLPSAASLSSPRYLAVDKSGNLFVSDTNNARVLAYTAPITSGMEASRVFLQSDFTIPNLSGYPSFNPASPTGIAVDGDGNLYIGDYDRRYVLEFDAALTSDATADRIIGPQVEFTGVSFYYPYDRLVHPSGLAVDTHGNLYIADEAYNRVFEYNVPLLTDTTPDRIFGHATFLSSEANINGASANNLKLPQSIAIDPNGNLFIVDGENSRVLEYDTPLIGDTIADHVFGQPNLTSNTLNNGGITDHSLGYPAGVAVDDDGHVYIADSFNNRLLGFDKPVPDPALTITRMNPLEVVAGGADFALTVEGTHFTSDAKVRWNGVERPTSFVGPNRLIAQIGATDIAASGTIDITIVDTPGQAISAARKLEIYNPTAADTIADRVLGQPARTSNTPKYGGPGAVGLNLPYSIAVQPGSGRIFIADTFNHRALSWPSAAAFTNGQAADIVIGQPNFAVDAPNQADSIGANTLKGPSDVTTDDQGNIYVADTFNHRVLIYAAPITNGMAASRVLGQPNFSSRQPNNGGISATSLELPTGVAVDGNGHLFVSDSDNSRVLEYHAPLTTDAIADRVFGQPNFTSNTPNGGGVSAISLNRPSRIVLDAAGNLFVSDTYNSRVLEYDAPLTTDTIADRVFGQPDFASSTYNNSGISANSLWSPTGIALDNAGNLLIADSDNSRVLEYHAPLTSDTTADRVFGQSDFTSNTPNDGGVSTTSLYEPTGIATDSTGQLFIVDTNNNRVLGYEGAISNSRVYLPLIAR